MSTTHPPLLRVQIEQEPPQKLSDANFEPRGPVHPSPSDWRDQVLYFLLPDRFADGQEDQRPMYDRRTPYQFKARDQTIWMDNGRRWQGGKLKGITEKLEYLQRLGVTAI